jgi:hypothetical protein
MRMQPIPAGKLAAAIVLSSALAAACTQTRTTTTLSSNGPLTAVATLPAPLTAANSAAPSPDPRVGLKGGWFDAAEAAWNVEHVSTTRPATVFQNPDNPTDSRIKSSDLAFVGNTIYQGNYFGWTVWDIANPRQPKVVTAVTCPGSQSDVSVYKNLLFVSHEATSGRVDCGLDPVQDTVSKDRARGVRVYDVSNPSNPKMLTVVQTCRGSHTHTLVTDPRDTQNVYIYVSGSAGVRSPNELPGCSRGSLTDNPNTSEFRIEVIQVPLNNPASAHILTSPRIFEGLASVQGHAEPGATARPDPRAGPNQCHDITVYPAIGRAGGACGGYGFLLDISDVKNPKRLNAVADSNMSFWHSATFSNDGSKVLFSDEWGGGTQARCRTTDKLVWGADAIFSINGSQMRQHAYFKMPAAQTIEENCVAHNGSLIPIPGRDIMVQAWYQGGLSVFDWTNPDQPKEIAFFDRGPLDPTKLTAAGFWSAYWYNGLIYASEEFRGLDVFELKPSPFISEAEIAAAKTVKFEQLNPQEQPKIVWPASFVLVRAYLDQLARTNGLSRDRATAIATELGAIERQDAAARRTALTALATALDNDARSAADAAKVRMMAQATRDLAAAQR